MTTKDLCVIPAHFQSRRLPGKVIARAADGKTMLEHCWNRAQEVGFSAGVLIATDNAQVITAAREFNAHPIWTEPAGCGSDRAAQILERLHVDRVFVYQADQPEVPAEDFETLKSAVTRNVSSLYWTTRDPVLAACPDNVKVTTSALGNAMYFSRHAIPHGGDGWKIHVGVYCYAADWLRRIAGVPRPAVEIAESLEQLRTLDQGGEIRMLESVGQPVGIDTPADFKVWSDKIKQGLVQPGAQNS